MHVVIVAAVGRNGVIGVAGGLPWRIPEDMSRFKRLTMGDALVFGRATFESIGRPLPGRTNIVLTHRPGWSHEGVRTAGSFPEAVSIAESLGQDLYVGGGAAVYEEAMAVADRMELTEVESEPGGDTWFPAVDWSEWREVSREPHEGFSFVTYDRRGTDEETL